MYLEPQFNLYFLKGFSKPPVKPWTFPTAKTQGKTPYDGFQTLSCFFFRWLAWPLYCKHDRKNELGILGGLLHSTEKCHPKKKKRGILGGETAHMLLCSPRNLGKMNPFWRIFFQMGLVQPPTSWRNTCLKSPEIECGVFCSGFRSPFCLLVVFVASFFCLALSCRSYGIQKKGNELNSNDMIIIGYQKKGSKFQWGPPFVLFWKVFPLETSKLQGIFHEEIQTKKLAFKGVLARWNGSWKEQTLGLVGIL